MIWILYLNYNLKLLIANDLNKLLMSFFRCKPFFKPQLSLLSSFSLVTFDDHKKVRKEGEDLKDVERLKAWAAFPFSSLLFCPL